MPFDGGPAPANLLMTRRVARALGSLESRLVLVGGCTVSVLAARQGYSGIRRTYDVDLVTFVGSHADWRTLEKELGNKGFRHGDSGPICRFLRSAISGSPVDTIDVMPSDVAILGFTNRWYEHVLQDYTRQELGEGLSLRVASAATLLATKLDAWNSRGAGDLQSSPDLEDIVALFDAMEDLPTQVGRAARPVRTWVANELDSLLGDAGFVDAIALHVLPDETSQRRVPGIIERMREVAEC